MKHRNLLYLDIGEAGAGDFLEQIASHWVIHRATTARSAQQLIKATCCRVGIARFGADCSGLCEPAIMEILFSDPGIKWVALLQGDTLEDREVRSLVFRYFHDYHQLPIDTERLKTVLGHAYGLAMLACDHSDERTTEHPCRQTGLVGNSKAIVTLRQRIAKIAAADTPLLITGESGTGKELAANLIHQSSRRAAGPFVAVNCAALPANLIQSELFGHEKGAFTGAHKQRIGRIEAANQGTIFLDEIGDLPPEMQITLLRFLEQQTIERVGGIEPVPVDVRIVAATNVDLHNAIEQNTFREDLYYRLKVLHLNIPSLRDRGQDLEMLANYFIHKFADTCNARIERLSQSALQAMYSYDWPGNVRELMNSIRGALVMSDGPFLTAEDLGLERRTMLRQVQALEESRSIAERSAILNAFEQSGGNITHAAEHLEISRGTLYRLMEKHAIEWPGKLARDGDLTAEYTGDP